MPSDTQTDWPAIARLFRSPLILALVVTAANALKPVVVDDTAYLAYARHIAANPLDPYGFTIFWYTVPDSAFEVLAPPVVPYWLALGVRLFGEEPAILKWWLFPFVWLFAYSVRELLQRFARGAEYLLPLVVLSPAALPAVNLMLDIPALALGLAAVVVFVRAVDRDSWRRAAAAGFLAALAIQTKYTMLLIPPVLVWHGMVHRRIAPAVLAVAVAGLAFAGWECLMTAKYGRSHFVFHLNDQSTPAAPGEGRLAAMVRVKGDFVGPLAGYLGCLGIGVGLAAAGAIGVARRWLIAAAFVWSIGLLLIAVMPYRWTVLVRGEPPNGQDTTAVMVFWQSFGWLVLLAFMGCAATLAFSVRKGLRLRRTADSLFLAGWLAIELAGCVVLTPFPAARRMIGVVVAGGLVAARVISRLGRVDPARLTGNWVIAFGAMAGISVAAIDTLDAFPEKVCAERAAARTADRDPGSSVWFAGHWGFQFYCERAGMRPIVPGQSVIAPGDYLVLPVHPDTKQFHRPHIGTVPIQPPPDIAEPIAEIVWDDPLSARTIPNFYGGVDPVVGRDHPRLRVAVYRMKAEWPVPFPR